MKRSAMNHTKMKKLMRALDVPQYVAVGILESLWHLTAREAMFGNIGKLSNEDIAIAIDWRGNHDELINALVSTGWIDASEESRLVIHDWMEHADDATKKAIGRLNQKTADNGGQVQTTADISAENRLPLPLPLPLPEPVKNKSHFALPDWIDPETWNAYEEMRKRIRKPLTDKARSLLVKKLEGLRSQGNNPEDVLNQSTMNAWQGLFEVHAGGKNDPPKRVYIS